MTLHARSPSTASAPASSLTPCHACDEVVSPAERLACTSPNCPHPRAPRGTEGVRYLNGPCLWTGNCYLDLANPQPRSVSLSTIAHNLARLARYVGATDAVWTVADHSLLAAALAEADGRPAHDVRVVLLHDAAEAYLGDMIRPVKQAVPEFKALEARVWRRAVAPALDLPDTLPDWVAEYDLAALALEKRDLIPAAAGAWPGVPESPIGPDIFAAVRLGGTTIADPNVIAHAFRATAERLAQ